MKSGFGRTLARAFAGAVIFGLPLMMTMEMWSLGFSIPSWKLALLVLLFFPLLVLLSWHAGFEETFSWRDDIVDALVAWAVGCVASAVLLSLFGLLSVGMSAGELVGKIGLQAVPACIGALLAQSQLGQERAREASGPSSRYASELFIMGVGALYLGFNLAPTQEIQVIALRMHPWAAVLLVLLSVATLHAFVYSLAFRGSTEHLEAASLPSLFLRFSVTGYALAFLLSAYILWTFGRLDGLAPAAMLQTIVVLGFPAAVGAAAARLIL